MDSKKMRTLLLGLLFFIFAGQTISANVPWENTDTQVEIKLRIPLDRLDEFRRMHSEMFKPLPYDWRMQPRPDYYYPFAQYDRSTAFRPGYPAYMPTSYYQQFQTQPMPMQKVPQQVPPPAKKKLPPPPPLESQKFLSDEIRFERVGEVYFKNGSSSLTSKSRFKLSKLASRITTKRYYYLNITGFTDIKGKKNRNERLGLARARRTAEFLQDLGVDMRNAYIGSGGESYAKKDFKKNRRAEIIGFFTPLPRSEKFTFEKEQAAFDKTRPSYFFFFIIGLIFLVVVGVAVYFVSTQ